MLLGSLLDGIVCSPEENSFLDRLCEFILSTLVTGMTRRDSCLISSLAADLAVKTLFQAKCKKGTNVG